MLLLKLTWTALIASVFHKQIINIGELKRYLRNEQIEVRCEE